MRMASEFTEAIIPSSRGDSPSLEPWIAACGETALQLFDWSQKAADLWRGSNNVLRREILDAVCLNRTLSDVSLVTEKRKPFDVLAKRPDLKNSRGDRIRTYDLLTPSQTR